MYIYILEGIAGWCRLWKKSEARQRLTGGCILLRTIRATQRRAGKIRADQEKTGTVWLG